jgi:hypothetical protein
LKDLVEIGKGTLVVFTLLITIARPNGGHMVIPGGEHRRMS